MFTVLQITVLLSRFGFKMNYVIVSLYCIIHYESNIYVQVPCNSSVPIIQHKVNFTILLANQVHIHFMFYFL